MLEGGFYSYIGGGDEYGTRNGLMPSLKVKMVGLNKQVALSASLFKPQKGD